MTLLNQTKCLLQRNYLLKVRNKKETLQEFIVPIFFMVILAGIRASIPTRDDPAIQRNSIPTFNLLQTFPVMSSGNSTPQIAFVSNNLTMALKVVEVLRKFSKGRANFTSQSTVDDMLTEYRTQDNRFSFGIVFEASNSSYLATKYTLLSPYDKQPSTLATTVTTDVCRTGNLQGGFACPANDYLNNRIVTVQALIDAAFRAVGENKSSLLAPNITLQMMSKAEVKTSLQGFFITVAIYFVMAFTPVISVLLINLVREKELKIKESMKIMGMKTLAFWFSWGIIYVFVILIVCLLMIAIAVPAKIFGNSNVGVVFIFLYLYGLSLVTLSFMLTPFFKSAKVAGTLAPFSTMILGVMTLPVTLLEVPDALKWVISVLSPAALTLGLSKATELKDGLQFDTLFDSGDSHPAGYSLLMLLVDILLYLVLAVYFDTVIPGEYGRNKSPFFCLMPSFWKNLFCSNSVHERLVEIDIGNEGFEEDADIEHVPDGLLPKRAIRIHNLKKSFKSSSNEEVFAVNGVSLDIYEDQITALLGHNGAGKTTLLSILTGLISSSEGTAEIYNHNINSEQGLENIRKITGVCPQQNILFENLTAYEHLQFFGGIKDIPADQIEAEIETLLNEVDLADDKTTFSKNLSGGQKRKLCLAIAFIGNPKIVFLDEPTSGMDPHSRRMVWSLLKRKCKGRVIFMTTHFMDEADILADYKAIMTAGKLRTAGSSLFLKNRFGIGYHLNMTVNERCDVDAMTELVQSNISGAQLAGKHGNELRFTLPIERVDQFPDLFSILEQSNSSGDVCAAPELGVTSYAVSMTTLEEVFLKLGEEEEQKTGGESDEELENEQQQQQHEGTGFAVNEIHPNSSTNGNQQPREDNTGRFAVEKQQFSALMKIRLLESMRSKLKIFFHILLPPALLLGGLLIARSKSAGDLNTTRKLQLKPSLYLSTSGGNSKLGPLLVRNFSSTVPEFVEQFKERQINTKIVNSLEHLLKIYPHNMAFDNIIIPQGGPQYSFLYNDSAVHSLPLAINIADSLVVSILRNVSSTIETYLQAFPSIKTIFKFDATSFNFALLVGMSLTIVPGGFAIPIVAMKEFKQYHQLRVSGVSSLVYWGTFFIFDFITLSIPAALIVILIPILDVKSFLVPPAMGALIIALFIYMNLAIVLVYVISFMFSSWQTANNVAPNIFNLGGVFGYIAVSLTDLIVYNDNPDIGITLHYVMLVVNPPYSIYGALYFIDRVYRFETVRQLSLDVSPPASDYFKWSEQNGVPPALLIPVFHLIFFTFLLFYLDARSRGKRINWPWRKHEDETDVSLVNKPKFQRDDDVAVDDDVVAERQRITADTFDALSDSHAVVTQGIWKKFRENKVSKLVVQDLCFSVDSGELFTLLGPNGAGKTTLMNIITSDLQPDAGKVYVSGIDVSSNMEQAYGYIGFCPQINAIWDEITLEEHLHCYANVKGVCPSLVKPLIDSFMLSMKIKIHAEKRAKNLSGGTKRKLQFGMCILGSPQLLLLDEPSSGMDPTSRRFLWDAIKHSMEGGRGAILTTHSMEEAEAVSTRVGIMVKGEMKAIGSTQHLKDKFGTGFILEVKLSPIDNGGQEIDTSERFQKLDEYIKGNFPGAQVSESFGFRATYKVPKSGVVALSKTFTALEKGKQLVDIEEYSFSQTTLEQVFLELAREQDDDRTGQGKDNVILQRSVSRRSQSHDNVV